jgi:Flp pilus assembly protein TadD
LTHRTALFLLCFTAWVCVAGAASVEEQVRAVMRNFYEQLEAASRAQAVGNADMVQKHQRNAEQFAERARVLLEEADAGKSRELGMLLLYGEVLGLQREYDLAADVLDRATKLAPRNAALWRSLGRALAEAGEAYAPQAHSALRQGLALDPSADVAVEIHQTQGRLYYSQGLYDLAELSYGAALALDSEAAVASIGMAALELQQGDVAAASERLQALGPAAAEYTAMIQGMLVQALRGFEKNRVWFADTAENHKSYGLVQVQANRLMHAVEPLERALALDPNDHVTWNLAASVYRGLGNVPRAKEALMHSLEVNPDQPRTREFLNALIDMEEAPVPPPSIARP